MPKLFPLARVVTRGSVGVAATLCVWLQVQPSAQAGRQQVPVTLPDVRSGLYLYRLEAHDPRTGALMAKLPGKMMHLR